MATSPKKKAAKKSAKKAAKKTQNISVAPGAKLETLQKQRQLRVVMKGKSIAERAQIRKSL